MVDANHLVQHYPIIKLWATDPKYRHFDFSQTKDRILDLSEDNSEDLQIFFQQLKVHNYISHQCHDPRSGDRYVLLLLNDHSEKIIKPASLVELVLAIIGNIKPRPSASEMCKLIVFTKDKLENKRIKGINNKLNVMAHISWMNVLYQHFTRQPPNLGPFCAPHTVMTPGEVEDLLSKLRCHAENLPKIRDDDPQIIWIPAQPGDVVRISDVSHTAGRRVEYRYVISSKEIVEDSAEEDISAKKEDDQQTEVGTELDADPEEFAVDVQSDRESARDQASDAESIAESDKDSDVISEPDPEDPEDHDEDPEDDSKSAASIFESATDGESEGSGASSDSDSESDAAPAPSRGRGRGRGQNRGRPRGTRGTRGSRGGRRGGRGGSAGGIA
jgi:DNA-directed RNA polymerase subunit H (RpoH/RPB5)